MRTLNQWLDWQAGLNHAEIDLGLRRVRQVWQRLHSPALDSMVITVAGTNGKGSCVALLEAILIAAGYSTGSYTSPHLLKYNERIRLSGIPVDDALICAAFERIEQARQDLPLTYFEFGTLAALVICADAAVDVIILEVGLGGRLDAVNIIDADAMLVTSIALDHQDWLGHDRESIGREKAGVFRPAKPAVFSGEDPPESLLEVAGELDAPLYLLGRDFSYARTDSLHWCWQGRAGNKLDLPLPALPGEHQLQNAAGVLMLLETLVDQLPLSASAIEQGLTGVRIDGREQLLGDNWLLDVAHNPHAVRRLAETVQNIASKGGVRAVLGMLNDKDAAAVFNIMHPLVDNWYLTSLDHPRAYTAEQLAEQLQNTGLQSQARLFSHLQQALDVATDNLQEDQLLLVFGSFYTVAGALQWREEHDMAVEPPVTTDGRK